MSLFHLAVTAVAPAAPAVTPEIIKQTLQPIYQNTQVGVTPPAVLQLAQLLALAGAGALTGFLHLIIERGKWPSNVNRAVWGLYSLAGSVGFGLASGNFDHGAAVAAVTSLIGLFGMGFSASATNNVVKFAIEVYKNAVSAFSGDKTTDPGATATQ